jgi:hypothetical protein
MAVRIRLAETTADLDALLRLRHRVFVDDKGYFPAQPDGRVGDRFDAYPTTAEPGCAARGTGGGRHPLRRVRPAGDAHRRLLRLLAVPSPGRTGGERRHALPGVRAAAHAPPGVGDGGDGLSVGSRPRPDHLVGAFAPEVATVAIGARPVAAEFVEPHSGLPVIPAVVDLAELGARSSTSRGARPSSTSSRAPSGSSTAPGRR